MFHPEGASSTHPPPDTMAERVLAANRTLNAVASDVCALADLLCGGQPRAVDDKKGESPAVGFLDLVGNSASMTTDVAKQIAADVERIRRKIYG